MADAHSYIEAMAKHLPPSAATLHLLDVGGAAGMMLADIRGDLNMMGVHESPVNWNIATDSVDAVFAFDYAISADFLRTALVALRPGGRLVVANPHDRASEAWVTTLENAGYTRILVEPTFDGVLIRGEKPHTEDRTIDRIQQVATHDANLLDIATYNGRYIHLLVRQSPNKPVWKLDPDERIEWQAVAIERDSSLMLLAFSSLPKAVALMQPAVMAGHIRDVNKIGKFSRETAHIWSFPVLLNPTLDTLEGHSVVLVPVDHQTAETPDEQ